MAIDTGRPIITGVILGTTLAPIYTVPSVLLRTKIDSISFTNFNATVNAKLTVQIIPVGEDAGDDNLVIKEKELKPNETYNAPEIVGQGIIKGGTLEAFSDIASGIACTATGTEYSASA